MREEFEAWVLAEHPGQKRLLARDERIYMNPHIQNRWHGWQASRAALKVELPASKEESIYFNEHQQSRNQGFNDCLERVTEALQQAGIEVAK
ncbi:hypothetical protein [Pseudomonas phage PAShipCat1]